MRGKRVRRTGTRRTGGKNRRRQERKSGRGHGSVTNHFILGLQMEWGKSFNTADAQGEFPNAHKNIPGGAGPPASGNNKVTGLAKRGPAKN